MSEQESNICTTCGGVRRVDWTISFEECHPVEMRFMPESLADIQRLCPGHPEPAPKHNGWLGPKAEGLAPHVSHNIDPWTNKPTVLIEHANRPLMNLAPHQALSLRDWLIQESPELERLVKGQRDD